MFWFWNIIKISIFWGVLTISRGGLYRVTFSDNITVWQFTIQVVSDYRTPIIGVSDYRR